MAEEYAVGRRDFLKTVGAVGFASPVLDSTDLQEIGDIVYDATQEVPFVEAVSRTAGEEQPIYNTLPKDEWERKFAVTRARDRLEDYLDDQSIDADYSLGAVVDEDSHLDLGVEVDVFDASEPAVYELEQSLPTEVDVERETEYGPVSIGNIPVAVEPVEIEKQCNYDLDNDWPDGVPGGAAIFNQDDTDVEGALTAPFIRNGVDGWVTAGHMAASTGQDIGTGDGDPLGEVEEIVNDGKTDCLFVEIFGNGISPDRSRYVANNDGSDYYVPVDGIIPDSGLEAHIGDSDWYVDQQGRETCAKGGNITAVHNNYAESDYDSKDGDSGGPVYHRFFDEAEDEFRADIAGPHGGSIERTFGENTAWFTTAETVESELSGYFPAK